MEVADETASMSNAKKKSKQKGGVNTEVSPSILLDVSVTGQEFVLAAAVDKKEGEASSSGSSESGKVSEQGDKTFSPSNADLMSVLCKMNSKLDSLNYAVNELTGTVFELKNEKNARMKTEIERLRKIEEEANRKLKEVQYQAALADQRSDAVEQYTRLTNVRFFNIEETEKWETAETSEDKVLAIICDKLELRHVKSEDIEIAHRVGKRNQKGARAVIVRFVSRKVKTEVFRNRKKNSWRRSVAFSLLKISRRKTISCWRKRKTTRTLIKCGPQTAKYL